MRVAVVGAGFSGLACALKLAKFGVDVSVFEADVKPGGLAAGFKERNWEWSLERHYHHLFTSDDKALNLVRSLNLKVIRKRPKTSTFIGGEIFQLDSPLSLLLFKKFTLIERIRTGVVLAYLKVTPCWRSLEGITSEIFLRRYMGDKVWEKMWKTLFVKKFGDFASEIPASWFWARVKKRSSFLCYPEGGFLEFAKALAGEIEKKGGKIFYKAGILSIYKKGDKMILSTHKFSLDFDKVVVTLPSFLFVKICKGLPSNYVGNLLDLKGLGAINLVLSLKKKFLQDDTYWLNVNTTHFPFLAVVEHTNFIEKRFYNNEHIVYIANYLLPSHQYFRKDAYELLKEFYPYLKTINPAFSSSWVNKAYLFKDTFAQPIISLNYSQKVPSFETPIGGIYLCNMQQVYPWDRGTNYAIELGEKVADIILGKLK